jgi:hypothetical protein
MGGAQAAPVDGNETSTLLFSDTRSDFSDRHGIFRLPTRLVQDPVHINLSFVSGSCPAFPNDDNFPLDGEGALSPYIPPDLIEPT